MAGQLLPGQRTWSMTRGEDGHRDYKLTYLVKVDITDGPANALTTTAGLPRPGDIWLVDDDYDPWAWCRHNVTITPQVEREPNEFFELEFTFSTRPEERKQDTNVENPLLEPPKVSGSFTKYQEEATFDRFGRSVTNSAWEQLRGPQVEFDANRPSVKIEQNVLLLGIEIFSAMVDTVNDRYMWGLPPRCIKLSNVSWERKYYARSIVYYTRVFDFDVNYKSFDRMVLDEGNKVLNGHYNNSTGLWVLDNIAGQPPDKRNPTHFIKYKDKNGDYTKVALDGNGQPWIPALTPYTLLTTCSKCPNGTPNTWYMTDTSELMTLTNTSGCDWSGTSDEATFTLTYSAADKKWLLTDTTGRLWYTHANHWNCIGPNTMTNFDVTDDTPTITLYSTNYPGYRFVSKYPESNFFLLGIPAVLG